MTGNKPFDAIQAKAVAQNPSVVSNRHIRMKEQKLSFELGMRYLYQASELDGGRRRATDLVWSILDYRLGRSVTKLSEPVLYYLLDDPRCGFVREELLVEPTDTQLSTDGVLTR